MSVARAPWPAAAAAATGARTVRLGARSYPFVPPSVRDPRLHLACVIFSLHILGQAALGFDVSIAQILITLATCAVIEFTITFWQHRILMWPASALLTGNGIAFILRVPGTEHGDWWSLNGIWIYIATATVAMLSKYLIRFRGGHVFNPSNFGLVLCFLLLGESRAEPLDFWWGPLSPWLGLAIGIILINGFLILSRLRMLRIAVSFWLAFAAGIGLLAASGHYMTARWHLGPITDGYFWWVLVTSPEIMIFMFFMITDPKTSPRGQVARVVYAASVGLLATLLIAPQTTEYASKVAVLASLALVCAARPVVERLLPEPGSERDVWSAWARDRLLPRVGAGTRGLVRSGAVVLVGVVAFASLLMVARAPARPGDERVARAASAGWPQVRPADVPEVAIDASPDIATEISSRTARKMARDVVGALRVEADAVRSLDLERAVAGADGAWLIELQRRIGESQRADRVVVPTYDLDQMRVTLARRRGQAAPAIMATIGGTMKAVTYRGDPGEEIGRAEPRAFRKAFEIAERGGHYVPVSDDLPPGWEPADG